ncbi:response regulator transcription factor [Georgenia faecalis]|uniref:response regulator transcription factor n=1 Tax=Georgenia faecalis TaxID=2483799 RepID=UPI000FDCB1A0|nr:response regulator transcription factor [Georgenia faecalis]
MPAQTEDRVAVVIEDDDDIRALLATTLGQGGFTVHAAGNGHDGVALVRRHDPVVTTLDISLPDIDGFEVARRVRTFSDAYIVMLTARAEEIDTLIGLDAGADDYLTKPFRPRELRARIEAMLRRPRLVSRATDAPAAGTTTGAGAPAGAGAGAGAPAASGVAAEGVAAGVSAEIPAPSSPAAGLGAASDAGAFDHTSAGAADAVADRTATDPHREHPEDVHVHNGLVIDAAARMAELAGEPLHLTRSEFEILLSLLVARGRVLSKADLVRELWAESYDTGLDTTEADRRAIEVHVANLRRKLREDAVSPRFIQTVRGVGYRLAAAR